METKNTNLIKEKDVTKITARDFIPTYGLVKYGLETNASKIAGTGKAYRKLAILSAYNCAVNYVLAKGAVVAIHGLEKLLS